MSFNRQNTNSSSTGYRPWVSPAGGVAAPVLVFSGPGQVLGARMANTTAAVAYVQYFDAASAGAVTLGTTQPVDGTFIPASGVINHNKDQSYAYKNGCVIAISTAHLGGTAIGTGIPVYLDVA